MRPPRHFNRKIAAWKPRPSKVRCITFSLVRKVVGPARAGMHASIAQRGAMATILYNAPLLAGR